jgi:hypothetical protein
MIKGSKPDNFKYFVSAAFCHFICFNPPHFRNGVGLVFSLFYCGHSDRESFGRDQGQAIRSHLFLRLKLKKRSSTAILHAFEHQARTIFKTYLGFKNL